jgi:hypothetical protein
VIPGQSLDVIVSYLPSPVTFGAKLTSYVFVLLDTNTGLELVRQPMVMAASGTGTWAGSATTTDGNFFPEGFVLIYAGQDTLLGPQVALANLTLCNENIH